VIEGERVVYVSCDVQDDLAVGSAPHLDALLRQRRSMITVNSLASGITDGRPDRYEPLRRMGRS
jgi:hypothetical protein